MMNELKRKSSRNYIYTLWTNMRRRCYNEESKSFGDYGQRGIVMCDAWKNNSTAFMDYILQELGPRPKDNYTLDRIDNNKGYEPDNLRWATWSQQMSNRRSYGKGYTWHSKYNKWQVQWVINGKSIYYGMFNSEYDAIARAKQTCPKGPANYRWSHLLEESTAC